MSVFEAKLNLNVLLILAVFLAVSFTCSCAKPKKEPALNSEYAPETDPPSKVQDDRPLIVAFGDSLTAGRGVDPAQNYPSKLQAKIDARGYRYRVVNAGVSGETTSQGRDRAAAYQSSPPAIAIVELGANDGLRGLPVEDIRRNLGATVSRFQSMGAQVVLAGMEVPPNYGPRYADSFRKIFQSVAAEYDAVLIPFFLEGVGGHAHLNQDDGIHPTAEGYDIVVENVWKVLEPLLEKNSD
jgi:acyl-CoA thioesterase-1